MSLYDADLSVLSGNEMRFAAKVLRKVSHRFGIHRNATWRPDELDSEADTVDNEEKDLAKMIIDMQIHAPASDYTARALAKHLIEQGWTKTT
jgi:hypothetical protein